MASNPSFDETTGALEVAEAYKDHIRGKTALITGVSVGGIGEGIARAFAHGGAADVIGRTPSNLSKVLATLTQSYPQTRFHGLPLDLNALSSAKRAAQNLLDDPNIPGRIDIAVANAGVTFPEPERYTTADDIELHFGVNHLAHFVFLTTMLPKMRGGPADATATATATATASRNGDGNAKGEEGKGKGKEEGRIIILTSRATHISPLRFSDSNFLHPSTAVPPSEQADWSTHPLFELPASPVPFSGLVAYGQSKTANVLMAVELNRRFNRGADGGGKGGVRAFAVHPGLVGSTGQKSLVSESMARKWEGMGVVPKTVDQGAATVVVAAVDPGLGSGVVGKEGVWLEDCQVSGGAPGWSVDEEAARKLWELSESIVREKLGE